MRRALPLAVLAATALPVAGAQAAPPPNDAPAGATPFATFTAENGRPTERAGAVALAEATADAGVPRCLGPQSFERTAWLRVAPAEGARRLVLTALPRSGEPDQAPQLAAFVGGQTTEPQACDGGGTSEPTAGVQLHVPAGQEVLVQVGRPRDGRLDRVEVSLAEAALAGTSPLGDLGTMAAPVLVAGRASVVDVGGARLTAEDPAQPACPAPATVWRRATAARTGTHLAAVRGPLAGALTVFRGARPTGEGAVACANAGAPEAVTAVRFRARRGDALWLRVGTEATGPGTVRLALSGPCDVQPLGRAGARPRVRIARVQGRRVTVRVAGGCVKALRLTAGGRTVRRLGTVAAGTRTVRLPRAVRRAQLRVVGRDAARKGERATVRGR